MSLEYRPWLLLAALGLDLWFGEAPTRVHPVVWMGRLTSWLTGWAPEPGGLGALLFGGLIAIVVPTLSAGLAVVTLSGLAAWPWLCFALAVFLLKSSFSMLELGRAAERMRVALAEGRVSDARQGLCSLCSRDPNPLPPTELAAATVESVAENTSDSIVAPLFYFVLFGVTGALAYRAVNTLDAMIGYRDAQHERLGKTAARLDDLLNLIPARLTAWLLLLAGMVLGHDGRRALRIKRRDAGKPDSPNAGHPMAVMAGLLGVELKKRGQYALGEPERQVTPDSIRACWRIARLATAFAVLLSAIGSLHGTTLSHRWLTIEGTLNPTGLRAPSPQRPNLVGHAP